jgi:hypothetical protein
MFRYAKLLVAIQCSLLLASFPAQASEELPKAGDAFEIVQTYETSSQTNGDDSSSSRGKSVLIERVIRVDEDGLELEYDEALNANGQRKGLNWQLPARIYRPINSAPTLLNAAELEKRIDPWLKKAKLPRDACGQWIFTWNAFKIECDPASALGIVDAYNLWLPNLAEGKLYSDASALGPAPLHLKSTAESGSVYVAELEIDPEKVKIGKAESDVVVGKIMGEPKTFDVALAKQANDKISGTISVTIEANASGQVTKRTNISKLRIEADGKVETSSKTVTLERRPLASTDPTKSQ